jgi:hypothetical protein
LALIFSLICELFQGLDEGLVRLLQMLELLLVLFTGYGQVGDVLVASLELVY